MDAATIASYNTFAEGYDQETAQFWETFPLEIVEDFVHRLPDRASVLSLGSGPGRDAELLFEYGLEVTSLDASVSMLEETEAKGFPSIEADMLDIPCDDDSFDAVWAYTSLLHLPREDVPQALSEIERVLKPDGVLFLAMQEGEGDRQKTTELMPEPRLFTYFSEEELVELLQGSFEVVQVNDFVPERRRYLHVIAKKLR